MSVRTLGLAVALFAAPIGAVVGQGGGAPVEGVTAHLLPNGLQLLLAPDPSRALVTVNVTYLVGSRQEGYGESGMAHLLEHLLFRGTSRHPDIPAELTARGAAPSGTTWPDRTSYQATLPATEDNLEWALDLEADRMVHSRIDAADLAAEMPVVRNEFEAGENAPVNILRQRVLAAAFPWHNYGRPTIGTLTDIEGVPIERLRAFYRTYYQPDNAVVVIAGAFDPARALAVVERTFGGVPRPVRGAGDLVWETHTREPPQDGERGVVLRRAADAEAAIVAWHVPGAAHPDFAAVEVLARVLGAPGGGRLAQAVEAPGIGANLTAFAQRLREPGLLFAEAVLRRGDPAEAGRDALLTAVARVLSVSPPSATEVERAKLTLLNDLEAALLDPVTLAMQLSEWAALGDWRLAFLHRDRLRAVTPADVHRVAVRYLRPTNVTVGLLKPESTPTRVEVPEVGDVAAALAGYRGDSLAGPGEPFDPRPMRLVDRAVVTTLPGGIRLASLPRPSRGGTVTVRIQLPFGRVEELQGLGAVPELTGQMLSRGTVNLDRQALGDAIARLGAELSVGGNATGAFAALTVRREQLAEALRLTVEMLRHPRFDARELEVLRQAQLAALDQQRSDPQVIALQAMQRHLSPWPPGHPYEAETPADRRRQLGEVTLDALRAFHDRFYGASHGEIAVVGDFALDTVRQVVLRELGGWTSLAPYRRITAPTVTPPRLDTVIAVGERANASLVVGRVLPVGDGHPDHAALVLADYLLGGGFLNSRLAARLRHREGLSYGVRSFLAAPLGASASTWIAMAIHAPEHLDRVVRALDEELRRAGRDGFSAEEVQAAKAGWLEGRKLARTGDAAVAGRMVELLAAGHDLDDDDALEARVMALHPADVQAVVARYLDPAMLSVVKAGDYTPAPDRRLP